MRKLDSENCGMFATSGASGFTMRRCSQNRCSESWRTKLLRIQSFILFMKQVLFFYWQKQFLFCISGFSLHNLAHSFCSCYAPVFIHNFILLNMNHVSLCNAQLRFMVLKGHGPIKLRVNTALYTWRLTCTAGLQEIIWHGIFDHRAVSVLCTRNHGYKFLCLTRNVVLLKAKKIAAIPQCKVIKLVLSSVKC
jgi:hypothetical protein